MNAGHSKVFAITVDTEEEGLWGSDYPVEHNTTENLRALPRFQSLCEQFNAPPTYLIDAPVLDDSRAIIDLRRWQNSQVCEVGSHCHPWCNPPLGKKPPEPSETYICNLPVEVQHAKLSWLTDRIADAFGRRPTSYRAGRYGFDQSSARVLDDLGYKVDSSILPLRDYRTQGGPDHTSARRDPHPFFGDPQRLIEIPICAGFTKPGLYVLRRQIWTDTRKAPWKHARLGGIADRLGFARRLKLSPEGTNLKDLKRLVDACVKDGMDTLVLMLHSTSLAAGFSPYAKDEEGLDQFYDRLKGILQYMTDHHGLQGVTLTEAAERNFPSADKSVPSPDETESNAN